VLCLSVFLALIDNTIVNVALPSISRQLHAATSDLQWTGAILASSRWARRGPARRSTTSPVSLAEPSGWL
jgi:hypothetical protein